MNTAIASNRAGDVSKDSARQEWARIKVLIILLFVVAHVVVTACTTVPGYLSVDEVVYNLMAKNFSSSWTLSIWNGYEEFPSPELAWNFIIPCKGRLVPQYPHLFTILSAPFYSTAGFAGLFYANAAAYLGVLMFAYAIAKQLFHDHNLALNAVLILIFGTFAWEYSQAAWPHMSGLLFTMGTFYFGLRARDAGSSKQGYRFAIAAGLIAGLAPGMRVDCLLVLPCVMGMFFFARPCQMRGLIAFVLGALPGLLVLSWLNLAKFNLFLPVSYGGNLPFPTMFVFVAGAIALLIWAGSRPPLAGVLRRNMKSLLLVVVVGTAILAFLPLTGPIVQRVANDAYTQIVDIRHAGFRFKSPAMSRSVGGGILYMGAHKKALLQSMPFLCILLIPAICIVRGRTESTRLWCAAVIPIGVLGFFSFMPLEYGGLCLNLRYFLIALPFLAMLSAYATRYMVENWGMALDGTAISAVAVATGAAYFSITQVMSPTVDKLEMPLLTVPIVLAVALLLFAGFGEIRASRAGRFARQAAWVVLVIAMIWSGLTAWTYDYHHHRRQRVENYNTGETVRSLVPAESMFFTAPAIDPFMRIVESDNVRIGFPKRDGFRDFPKLVKFHLDHGRRVFAVFPATWWNEGKVRGLKSYEIRRMVDFPGLTLAEIGK